MLVALIWHALGANNIFCVSDQKNARLSGDLSGKLSSPAVQQLWTLYPGKQTANLFLWECFKPRALYDLTTQHTLPPATTVVIPKRFAGYKAQWLILLTRPEKKKFIGQDLRGGKRKNASSISPTLGLATVYCKTTTAKELWESLERKYKTEGCWYKEVRGSLFLDYKMVDSKNDDKSGSGPAVLLIARCRSGCIMSGKFGGLRLWTDCDGSCLSCVPDLYGFIMVEQLTMDRSVYGHLEMLFQGIRKNLVVAWLFKQVWFAFSLESDSLFCIRIKYRRQIKRGEDGKKLEQGDEAKGAEKKRGNRLGTRFCLHLWLGKFEPTSYREGYFLEGQQWREAIKR
ncbi:hypothetical protein Tco_0099719 [Tanacetum coccineum]